METTQNPTTKATDKQLAFLERMMRRCYDAHTVHTQMQQFSQPASSGGLTKAQASEFIQRLIDAGYGDPKPATTSKPSRRQQTTRRSDYDREMAEDMGYTDHAFVYGR